VNTACCDLCGLVRESFAGIGARLVCESCFNLPRAPQFTAQHMLYDRPCPPPPPARHQLTDWQIVHSRFADDDSDPATAYGASVLIVWRCEVVLLGGVRP
jgi:hypothetical protein